MLESRSGTVELHPAAEGPDRRARLSHILHNLDGKSVAQG